MKSDTDMTTDSGETATDPATAHLKHDIEQTRADMSGTIAALETRLSPSEVRDKVGVELQHVEDRIRVVVGEQLAEAKTLVQASWCKPRTSYVAK